MRNVTLFLLMLLAPLIAAKKTHPRPVKDVGILTDKCVVTVVCGQGETHS